MFFVITLNHQKNIFLRLLSFFKKRHMFIVYLEKNYLVITLTVSKLFKPIILISCYFLENPESVNHFTTYETVLDLSPPCTP